MMITDKSKRVSLQIKSTAMKATKNKSYDLIMDLKTGRRELTDSDVDSLLLYFAPPTPKTPKNDTDWLKLAVGIDDLRHYLNFLHVTNGVMYATDGHRMHYCTTGLTDGFYCSKTLLPTTVDGRYPDVLRVIPSRPDGVTSQSEMTRGITKIKDKVISFYELPGEVRINETLLKNAIGDDKDLKFKYITGDSNKIYGESKFGSFIVMGMKLK